MDYGFDIDLLLFRYEYLHSGTGMVFTLTQDYVFSDFALSVNQWSKK